MTRRPDVRHRFLIHEFAARAGVTVKVLQWMRGSSYDLLTRYHQAHLGLIMQSIACNAVHSVEQRLARWPTASARTHAAQPPACVPCPG
jgi:hypothetical protein